MYSFYPWNVYIAESTISRQFVERPSKQAKKKRRTRFRNYLQSDTLARSLSRPLPQFRLCCCFKRRWIQFTKMPGGRRGLVAPQNTFLENIIRRSNSQRKYIRFSHFVFFSAVYCIPRCVRVCAWYDYEIVNGYQMEKQKRRKWNPMNVSSKVNQKRLEMKEKEKLCIIKNSVKNPIELTLTASVKRKVEESWMASISFIWHSLSHALDEKS